MRLTENSLSSRNLVSHHCINATSTLASIRLTACYGKNMKAQNRFAMYVHVCNINERRRCRKYSIYRFDTKPMSKLTRRKLQEYIPLIMVVKNKWYYMLFGTSISRSNTRTFRSKAKGIMPSSDISSCLRRQRIKASSREKPTFALKLNEEQSE